MLDLIFEVFRLIITCFHSLAENGLVTQACRADVTITTRKKFKLLASRYTVSKFNVKCKDTGFSGEKIQ